MDACNNTTKYGELSPEDQAVFNNASWFDLEVYVLGQWIAVEMKLNESLAYRIRKLKHIELKQKELK